jgi:hypothetical protein
VPAQLGVACCPCSGHTSEADYAQVVDRAVRGLTAEPSLLLEPLAARMGDLASVQRFEEAALTRDRLSVLTRSLRRQRLLDRMTRAGRMVVEAPEGRVELDGGRLAPVRRREPGPVARDEVDEMLVVGRWLDERARTGRLRLLHTDGELASALPIIPSYEPRGS